MPEHRIGLIVSQRFLDEGDLEPVDEHTAFALEYVENDPAKSIGFEAGIAHSEEDDTVLGIGVEAELLEVYLGVRKEIETSSGLVPYIGGGLTYLNADLTASVGAASASDDDSSLGIYLRGGVLWDLTSNVYVGLDARLVVGTDLEIGGASGDADYEQIGVLLGFSF